MAMVTAGFKCPTRGDDDRAGVVSFGAGEHHVGHNAVSKNDEQRGSDEFSEVGVHRMCAWMGGGMGSRSVAQARASPSRWSVLPNRGSVAELPSIAHADAPLH